MRLIKLLFVVLLVALPLGQFTRIPVSTQFAGSLYIYDLILPILIGAWLIWCLGRRKSLQLPPLSGRILLFAWFAGMTLANGARYLNSSQSFWLSGFYLWRWLMYAGIYFVLYTLLGRWPNFGPKVYHLLAKGAFVFACIGLAQFLLFPDFSRLAQHGWDPHYYRVLSTLFDPNFAGLYLSLGFIVIAVKAINRSDTIHTDLFFLGTILIAIILTFSRSTYLAFGTAIITLGLLNSRKLLVVMLLAALVAFATIPRVRTRVVGAIKVDKTAQLRLQDYVATWTIIRDHPLLGVGFNTFRYVQEQYGYFRDERGVNHPGGHAGAGADNSFLFLWATTGIFGLTAYLWLLWGQFKLGWDNFKSGCVDSKIWGLVLLVSVLAVVVHSQFVNSLFFPWIMAWIWVLTALNATHLEHAKTGISS